MTKPRGNPSWVQGARAPVPDNPPQWERMLARLELADTVAAAQDKRVKEWVRQNYRSRWVPSAVLTVLGIKEDLTV